MGNWREISFISDRLDGTLMDACTVQAKVT